MNADDKRHGTNRGATAHYFDGEEPCYPCRRAKSRYMKRATLDKVEGRSREVTLGETAHTIVRRAPLGYLSAVSGLAREHLVAIRRGGPEQSVFRTTRSKIIATKRLAYWSNEGIQRRIQALMALGWNGRAIATEGGAAERSIIRLAKSEHHERVRYELALKVLVAYEALSMRLPPERTPNERGSANKTRQLAQQEGFLPPLAWNDIDDPNERPLPRRTETAVRDVDPVVVDRILSGDMTLARSATKAERVEVVRRWAGSLNELERLTSWEPRRYVQKEAS